MKDEYKMCGNCRHEHAYGIVRYSADNVPLYGARSCGYLVKTDSTFDKDARSCGCTEFVEYDPGMENLPALTLDDTKALWAETSFLNAQVPMATRIAVRQIQSVEDEAERQKQFMGLMISQVTDIRGALTKDESKFARLVSHADEVTEAMSRVTQLAERLEGVNRAISELSQVVDNLGTLMVKIAEKVGVDTGKPEMPPGDEFDFVNHLNNAPIRDEAVVVDAKPFDDHD